MITDTKQKILVYIQTHHQARVHDLVRVFNLSQVAIHKQLNNLLKEGKVMKTGKPPLVFYIPSNIKIRVKGELPGEARKVIDINYLYISPSGDLLYGFEGFARWVESIKEVDNLDKLALEYVKSLESFKQHFTAVGWIDASQKLKNTFPEVFIDKLLYGDFYSLPKFGKTKLGQLVLYAKQSQNRGLMRQLASTIKPLVQKIIKEFSIDAVVYIPPTVPRNLQFINELVQDLDLPLPHIELVKITPGEVIVAQKTLSHLEERITNARDTIFLKSNEYFYISNISYSNVLLIDDAAGSGATFNETAGKLKGVLAGKSKIIAFSIVGSFKGFDVIREV